MNPHSLPADVSDLFDPASTNTAITEDGLVLKNIDKVERIKTRMDSRVTVYMHAWQTSREIRRDFNFLSSKMFSRSRDARFQSQVRDLTLEMVAQCEFLKIEAEPFQDRELPEPMQIPLRIISPEAAILLRAFCDADKPIAYLNRAAADGVINIGIANELILPFLTSYRDLKMFLTGIQASPETAHTLGEKAGIS